MIVLVDIKYFILCFKAVLIDFWSLDGNRYGGYWLVSTSDPLGILLIPKLDLCNPPFNTTSNPCSN